ncbi:MAG: 50S ribosomal protein L6 [Alphaproteobacteria bacterium]|nr:50S ribosomal protein L6 [Alphaproteobacteria bacterium]
MSRLGKMPIEIPSGLETKLEGGFLTVKGKVGSNRVKILPDIDAKIEGNKIVVSCLTDSKRAKIYWGTTRQLIKNAVQGAAVGFTRRLELNGVGFRVQLQGKNLKLALGFSHDVLFPIPDDLKVTIEGEKGNVIAISGANRETVGLCASLIRGLKKPEPYKGKGIKYAEETILRKEGKKK